jgi:tetratricopeptide (TPR) repeat protein
MRVPKTSRPAREARGSARPAAPSPAPPLLRDPWAWLAPLAVLPLLARCIGAPLGEPVAEDFDFLHRALLQGTGTLLDGGGSVAFWRPLAHQLYYAVLGRLVLAHPAAVAAIHALFLAAGALLLYRVLRPRLPGPLAAVAASFPLLAESTRTLVGWPTQFVDVGLFFFSALALHEASRHRLPGALAGLLAALLCKELALVTAVMLPFVPGALARRDRVRLGVGAAAVALLWGAAYMAVRHAAHLELPHGLERDPADLAVPLAARLAWAFSGSLRAIFSRTLLPGRFDGAVLAAAAACFVAAGAVLAISPAARARFAALRAPFAWGLAWFVLFTASLAPIYPLWQPNRSQIGSVGLGVASAVFLGAAHPLLPAGLVAVRLGLLAMAPAPATSVSSTAPETGAFMDFERLTRLQRLMREMRTLLRASHPTLPRGSAVVRGSMPHGLVYAFGGDKALQVWYGDSTLRLMSSAAFRDRPGTVMAASVQFEPGHLHDVVQIPVPAMLAQEQAYQLLYGHRSAEALALYARADSLGPDSLAYIFRAGNAGGRAFALTLLGRHDEASAAARAALELNPGEINARLVLADRAMSTGRYAEAQRMLQSILADDPNQKSARLMQSLLARSGAGGAPAPAP